MKTLFLFFVLSFLLESHHPSFVAVRFIAKSVAICIILIQSKNKPKKPMRILDLRYTDRAGGRGQNVLASYKSKWFWLPHTYRGLHNGRLINLITAVRVNAYNPPQCSTVFRRHTDLIVHCRDALLSLDSVYLLPVFCAFMASGSQVCSTKEREPSARNT